MDVVFIHWSVLAVLFCNISLFFLKAAVLSVVFSPSLQRVDGAGQGWHWQAQGGTPRPVLDWGRQLVP